MKSDITDRMKKNTEIGRIAMILLRSGMDISDKTARLVAMTVENPDVGRARIEADGSQDALAAVWILDDAENMAPTFADLEGRINKLRIMLEKEQYEIVLSDAKKKPFAIQSTKEEKDDYELGVVFGTKKVLEAQFGASYTSSRAKLCSLSELEARQKALQTVIRIVKKMNGLGIKGEEKALRLAVFSVKERHHVRQTKARRLEVEKSRGSI